MIRIAVIMGKMHSGGKKNLVMEYYRHIDRNKVQFDFLCDEDSNSIPKEEIESLGGRVYVIPPYQKIFANMKAIIKICKKNKYSIMHGYNSTMNIFCMLAGKIAGVPVRINECISMGHKDDKKDILKKVLKPFACCFSTHYMANGEVCGRWQFGDRKYEAGKVKVFKTVIDTKKNKYQLDLREKTRKELNLDDNIVIGHIGRLTAQKNTLFIIDIFNEIVRMDSKARLLIIGDGELKEEMLDRIKNYKIENEVLYLGRREDIQQFYNAMDVFLLPSLYEGLPVVGVEAECCGLPMFFSTEIPRESSPCEDIGFFIGLDKSPKEWAEYICEKFKQLSAIERRDQSIRVKAAGFDSENEGKKLTLYYEQLLRKNI